MCSDLTKLFVEVRGIHQCSFSYFFIIHLLIPRNEEGAQEFLHFDCNIHGDWDNEIEQNHEGQEVCEHS